jgi:hypothetical protein
MFRATFCPSSRAILTNKQTTAKNTSTLASITKPEAAATVQIAPDDGQNFARNMLNSG